MKFPSENFISTSEIFLVLIDMLQCIHMVLTDRIIMICACHQQELASINDKLAILESSGDQPRAVFNKKKSAFSGKGENSKSGHPFRLQIFTMTQQWSPRNGKLKSHMKKLQKRC